MKEFYACYWNKRSLDTPYCIFDFLAVSYQRAIAVTHCKSAHQVGFTFACGAMMFTILG
ncbi:MAG: hypothetical protein KME30_08720 [Iphinoe sp. HA4291-MV1]|nr:hypothetical protein [Iphinoe sp. HA4291-MV1]